AFKILSRVFNFDHAEVAANPVHLFYVLEQQIEREQFPQEQAEWRKRDPPGSNRCWPAWSDCVTNRGFGPFFYGVAMKIAIYKPG
ncbi:hypothetical protein ONK29_26220, partial [Salmonella enterica subsp. enterica serovar Anatum]|nr:hypothetical protein [Salmonella enterica subsp. enterica serovar Anatum]